MSLLSLIKLGQQNACKRRRAIEASQSQENEGERRTEPTPVDVWTFEKLKVGFCSLWFLKASLSNMTCFVTVQAYIAYVKSTFHPMLTVEAETVLTK
jgi:DNA replicative helicase MCM subunit Mcm2 (Cdc46/Mcm family)